MADLENHRASRDFEYGFKTDTEEPKTFKISGKPIFSKDGRFTGYRGVGSDVTQELMDRRKIAKATHFVATHEDLTSRKVGEGRLREATKHILLNLLSNAVKFTPEKGRVTLSVRSEPDGGLLLEVQDTGIGMDKQGIEKALTQFGQVDSTLARKNKGTGLGLPLTKSLVEVHGGVLDIYSRRGHGTTVVAHFPSERSIKALPKNLSKEVKSPDQNAGGELAIVSGDHVDKKIPTVH